MMGTTQVSNSLFSSDLWRRALESFAQATQLTIYLFDVDSRPILGPVHRTPLFQLFETTGYDPGIFGECARRCLGQSTTRPAVVISEFYGLAVTGTSLVLDGATVGAAVAGYAFVDFYQVSEVQRLAQNSGITFELLWRVVREQRPVPKQRLVVHAELLQVLGDALLRENYRTRQYGAALTQSELQLRALTARILTSQEDERRHLARELHDDFNQRVASFQNQLYRLRLHMNGRIGQQEEQQLEDIEKQLGQMADDIRDLSHGLHPSILDDLGLEVALKHLVSTYAGKGCGRARFKGENTPGAISTVVATTLYRIAQEALSNVRKHAPTASAAVTLNGVPNGLRLVIEDNGPGFNIQRVRQDGGLGLRSMQERAHLVGGEVNVTTAPGSGTRIEVIVPLSGEM